MTLYQKRQRLGNLKIVLNKLNHHLFDLRAKVVDLQEEVREDELKLYLATVEDAVTYIPPGRSGLRQQVKQTTTTQGISRRRDSAKIERYTTYINTLPEELKADFIKLDMSIIRDIWKSPRKLLLVEKLVDFCNAEGILVVAEGIECTEEATAVIEAGCHLLQGYHFGRPGSLPSEG